MPLNIINPDAANLYCDAFVGRCRTAEIQQWCRHNLRNAILRDKRFMLPLRSLAEVRQHHPIAPWMPRAFASDETAILHLIVSNEQLPDQQRQEIERFLQQIELVIDWMNQLPENLNRRLDRVSVQQAITSAEHWHAQLARRAEKKVELVDDDEQDCPTAMSFDDGYRIAQITTEDGLLREGSLMGHCVGGYYWRVSSGNCQIYSLRDAHNRPHATMEIVNGRAIQIKGKSNVVPVAKYWPHLRSFIKTNQFGVGAGTDGERIGLFTLGNRTYFSLDDILDQPPLDAKSLAFGTGGDTMMRLFRFFGNHKAEITPERQSRLAELFTPDQNHLVVWGKVSEITNIGDLTIRRHELNIPLNICLLAAHGFVDPLVANRVVRTAVQHASTVMFDQPDIFVLQDGYLLKAAMLLRHFPVWQEIVALRAALMAQKRQLWDEQVSLCRHSIRRGKAAGPLTEQVQRFLNVHRENLSTMLISETQIVF